MKRTATALTLGVLIGMGIGPALAGAYNSDPPQDSTRALQDISRTLKSIDSTLKRRER
jgi:hypothetical protein